MRWNRPDPSLWLWTRDPMKDALATCLPPHKSRYWLNTTEKAPPEFQEQVGAVCDT
jgi:hypothetical protein